MLAAMAIPLATITISYGLVSALRRAYDKAYAAGGTYYVVCKRYTDVISTIRDIALTDSVRVIYARDDKLDYSKNLASNVQRPFEYESIPQ